MRPPLSDVKPKHSRDSILLLTSKDAEITDEQLIFIRYEIFLKALKPLRATTFNSSGLIPADKIKLPKGFTDKNILKAVIDLAGVTELLCTSSTGDGTDEMDTTAHETDFTFKSESANNCDAFLAKLKTNGQKISEYLHGLRERFTKLDTIVLIDDHPASPAIRATLKGVSRKYPIFLKQIAYLNRLRPPDYAC